MNSSDKQLPIFCPICDQSGMESLMQKVRHTASPDGQMTVRCARGHEYDYQRLLELKPRMQKLQLTEKQPVNTVAQQFWVYPEVLSALQRRFPQNFMTTICAALTALADPDTVMIEGEHARALRATGVARGRDIVGLAAENARLTTQVNELKIQMKVLEPFLKAIGGQLPTGETAEEVGATVEYATDAMGAKVHGIPAPKLGAR
jgi:hypothetical protein